MAIETTGMTPLLQVFDMPEALAFYGDRLGFSVVDRSPEVETPEGRFSHWVWLRLGPCDLMLNTAYDAGERPAKAMRRAKPAMAIPVSISVAPTWTRCAPRSSMRFPISGSLRTPPTACANSTSKTLTATAFASKPR